jgi:hypothetical protein
MKNEDIVNNEAVTFLESINIKNMLDRKDEVLNFYKKSCDDEHIIYVKIENFGKSFLKSRYDRFLKVSEDSIRDICKDRDCSSWNILMDKSRLSNYMDDSVRIKWEDMINKGEFLEFNYKNIVNVLSPLYESKKEMFNRSILDFYKCYSWDRVNNKPLKIEKKIVIYGLVRCVVYDSYKFDWDTIATLDKLANICHILTGNVPVENTIRGILYEQKEDGKKSWDGHDFNLILYKNGNCHVTFTNFSILNQINTAAFAEHEKFLINENN